MSIEFACECGKKFAAREELAGKGGICPACNRKFVVPDPNAPPPVQTDVEYELIPKGQKAAKTTKAFWNDPVLVIGSFVPAVILAAFLGYIARGPSVEYRDVVVRPARNPKVPIEVSYPVIDGYREPPIKHGLDVQLNMKVSEEVLREIALELKSQETEQYESTYITYYLPGLKETGSWANADFAPTLKIDIMGMTIEEEQFLLRQPFSLPEGSELIGSWLPSEAFIKWRITIFRKDGKHYLEALFRKGKGVVQEMIQRPAKEGLDLQKVDGDDHYIIDRYGELVVRDDDGIVSKPRKIK